MGKERGENGGPEPGQDIEGTGREKALFLSFCFEFIDGEKPNHYQSLRRQRTK